MVFGAGYGEMIGIDITPVSDTQTKVEVALQKRHRFDIGYKDCHGLILNQVKTILISKNIPAYPRK